jgi:small GTP-binding protein
MRRVKILVLGDSGVGKSCLITRWTADAFSANIVSTVGVNFKSKRVHLNNEYVQVQVWDTAGQEHFHKITTSYYRGANGIMLVYDVSDAKTMENAEYWIKNIKAHASESVRVALIGNKTDLRTATGPDKVSCTDPKLATGYAEMFGVPYFETSAKESTNVDLAFMSMVEGIITHSPLNSSPKAPPSPAIGMENRQTLTEKAVKLKKGMFDKIRGKKEKTDCPLLYTSSASTTNPNSNSSSPSPTPKYKANDEKEKCILS